ncbi:RluA family pseudouridine synthase [Niveibacterium sp. 24ML]|uniref:RluA family pseudouridine synthase n=1 Tax=Niveibacterium sp. 24ML TaxID=2985512 RepID=UPI00226F2C4E|nr:RluA family pseudouridine synthase [Niveibacterium sp. 24ML]MCX9154938.1 RluA family pseudouridine synthase [Niveibacterium sp. 24ML]
MLHCPPSLPSGFRLLYADDALLALDKPAGLLSVPGRGEDKQDCLSARVQASYPDAQIVHRLDMATSGILLMARGAPMQRLLSIAFQTRALEKHYVAIVSGLMPDDAGSIDLPLAADWPQRPRQKVDLHLGKPSLTHWQVLARDPVQGRSTVRLTPVTGRSHQLRVHLQALGHPILGDALYASGADAAHPRLMLHACTLRLAHPLTGAPLEINCPAPFLPDGLDRQPACA